MPDDNQSQDVATLPVEAQAPVAPVSDVSSQSNGSTSTDLPPEAPESPTSDIPTTPVESVNSGLYHQQLYYIPSRYSSLNSDQQNFY